MGIQPLLIIIFSLAANAGDEPPFDLCAKDQSMAPDKKVQPYTGELQQLAKAAATSSDALPLLTAYTGFTRIADGLRLHYCAKKAGLKSKLKAPPPASGQCEPSLKVVKAAADGVAAYADLDEALQSLQENVLNIYVQSGRGREVGPLLEKVKAGGGNTTPARDEYLYLAREYISRDTMPSESLIVGIKRAIEQEHHTLREGCRPLTQIRATAAERASKMGCAPPADQLSSFCPRTVREADDAARRAQKAP